MTWIWLQVFLLRIYWTFSTVYFRILHVVKSTYNQIANDERRTIIDRLDSWRESVQFTGIKRRSLVEVVLCYHLLLCFNWAKTNSIISCYYTKWPRGQTAPNLDIAYFDIEDLWPYLNTLYKISAPSKETNSRNNICSDFLSRWWSDYPYTNRKKKKQKKKFTNTNNK